MPPRERMRYGILREGGNPMRALFGRGSGTRETTWPAVHLAYDFVLPSYQWAQQRLDATDLRIQTLQAFAATVTLAAPILAATVVKDIDLQSAWFIAALALFVVTVVLGAVVRAYGRLELMSPKRLYDRWLGDSEWEFKKDAIYFAGKHFEANRSLINKKGLLADGMTVLFVVETALLLTWVLAEV